jgi:ribosome-binding protein aMBF1 (putative translation factor)
MKAKFVSLDEILEQKLKDPECRILYNKYTFYLQMAQLISELRSRAGWSQARLAQKAGISQPMIARLERGDHKRNPTFETISRVLTALGYELSLQVQKSKKKVA